MEGNPDTPTPPSVLKPQAPQGWGLHLLLGQHPRLRSGLYHVAVYGADKCPPTRAFLHSA
jgi:hypothetical protein